MTERLVDVKTGEKVLHTFPVTISDRGADTDEDAFKKKALEAAAHAKLVPNKELKTLSVHMHAHCKVGMLGPKLEKRVVSSQEW